MSDDIHCSFCGEHQRDVTILVASPNRTAFICNKCVPAAVEVVAVGGVPLKDVADPKRIVSAENVDRERELRLRCLRLAFEQCCHPLAPPAVGDTADPFALAERIFAFVMGRTGKPEGSAE